MTLQFRIVTLTFPVAQFTPGSGQARRYASVKFGHHLLSAQAALKSFDIKYDGNDHHLLRMNVDVDSAFAGNKVTISADLHLRDSSGNIDDPFGGTVKVLVVADVAAA